MPETEEPFRVQRHSRLPFDSAVHLVRSGHSWSTELIDISATGLLVERPDDCEVKLGEEFVVDLVIDNRLNIDVKASVARIADRVIGLHFTHIPAEKGAQFWSLLGEFAHQRDD